VPNDRLRDAVLRNGFTPASVAQKIGVDPKTVERWIHQDRIPYPKHRHAIAALLRESESYLWPNALSAERVRQVTRSEVVQIHARRGAVPPETWQRLLDKAERQVGILVYGGLFLPEQNPRWVTTLRKKADSGVQVDILLGDPKGHQIAERGADEGIGSAMASKVYNVLTYYKELRDHDNITINLHDTTLYNSIYRFDDEMLVNTHLYGTPAAYAPVLHLRQLPGGELFDSYVASFNRVASKARPVGPDEW
jgi:transcriptional regulator with XRE-family HTH domain